MKRKILLLFQLLLAVSAFYVVLHYRGNHGLLLSLACVLAMFVVGKAEASLTERSKRRGGQGDHPDRSDSGTPTRALECLLKSKNVLLLTDAIHSLMGRLGLVIGPCSDHPAIDRLIRIPGTEITVGLKVVGDIGELEGNWKRWDRVAGFDLGMGGRRRLLVIASNCVRQEGGRQRYRNFSEDTRRLLAARGVVAMTTLTLGKIYLLCEKKRLTVKTVFYRIQQHPGGVFQLEHYASRSNHAG